MTGFVVQCHILFCNLITVLSFKFTGVIVCVLYIYKTKNIYIERERESFFTLMEGKEALSVFFWVSTSKQPTVYVKEREQESINGRMGQHFTKVCHCNLTTSTPRMCEAQELHSHNVAQLSLMLHL